jgi:hypothetical protein
MQVWSYGDVASVKKAVNVPAEQEPVLGFVFTAVAIGAYMGGFQRRPGFFLADRVPALIGVCY